MNPGRNDPCPCGSGKKYKKCCLPKGEEAKRATQAKPPDWDDILTGPPGRFSDLA
jgi:hypothetical protein